MGKSVFEELAENEKQEEVISLIGSIIQMRYEKKELLLLKNYEVTTNIERLECDTKKYQEEYKSTKKEIEDLEQSKKKLEEEILKADAEKMEKFGDKINSIKNGVWQDEERCEVDIVNKDSELGKDKELWKEKKAQLHKDIEAIEKDIKKKNEMAKFQADKKRWNSHQILLIKKNDRLLLCEKQKVLKTDLEKLEKKIKEIDDKDVKALVKEIKYLSNQELKNLYQKKLKEHVFKKLGYRKDLVNGALKSMEKQIKDVDDQQLEVLMGEIEELEKRLKLFDDQGLELLDDEDVKSLKWMMGMLKGLYKKVEQLSSISYEEKDIYKKMESQIYKELKGLEKKLTDKMIAGRILLYQEQAMIPTSYYYLEEVYKETRDMSLRIDKDQKDLEERVQKLKIDIEMVHRDYRLVKSRAESIEEQKKKKLAEADAEKKLYAERCKSIGYYGIGSVTFICMASIFNSIKEGMTASCENNNRGGLVSAGLVGVGVAAAAVYYKGRGFQGNEKRKGEHEQEQARSAEVGKWVYKVCSEKKWWNNDMSKL